MSSDRFQSTINLSLRLRDFTEMVGRWAALMFIPTVLITVWDVVARKIIWIQRFMMEHFGDAFSSTVLQELEWYSHTVLFALVFGYGLVTNRHVRVDLVRTRLASRSQAWIEFLGTTIFAIPFTLVMIYFCYRFALNAFIHQEVSQSLTGLGHPWRWIIKAIFGAGMVVSLLAVIGVWLQTVVVLLAPRTQRFELMTLEWPEELGSGVEGYRRVELDEADTSTPSPG